jgi:hypothetical protein
MLVNRIALVPGIVRRDALQQLVSEMRYVAAALQTQVERDFKPFWAMEATVTTFPSKEDVPIGFWPIFVQTSLGDPADMGYHWDTLNQPYARVLYDPAHPMDWSLTASHEVLEMLADPFGNRLVAGTTIDKRYPNNRVLYLLEVCDPCEDVRYAYTIDGILVSDFITPHYYDPGHTEGARYSFSGAVKRPRDVLPGGYLDWHDPARGFAYELYRDGPNAKIKNKGRLPGHRSLREQSNHTSPHYRATYNPRGARVTEARARRAAAAHASQARAATW